MQTPSGHVGKVTGINHLGIARVALRDTAYEDVPQDALIRPSAAHNDPRGPERKIVNVEGVETPCKEGILYHVRVTLDCGHVKEPNPTFSYSTGERYRCYGCDVAA